MTNAFPFVLALVSFLQFEGMDIALMEKWSTVAVVKYRVEGVHKGRDAVVFGDYEGKADVIDRITVEFRWDNKRSRIVGPVTVVDGKSELTNIRSDGTNCGPPQLKSEYEHFQSVSNSMSTPDQIQITGTRIYPAAMVSNYPGGCSMRSIPGGKEEVHLWVTGAGPEGLGLPIKPGMPFSAAADRKSFSAIGADNWVWTYTPTLVK